MDNEAAKAAARRRQELKALRQKKVKVFRWAGRGGGGVGAGARRQ